MTQCAHLMDLAACATCNPRIAYLPEYGPWCEARYRGDCAACGGMIVPGDAIRSDGEGGWLCIICGDRGDGLETAPVKDQYL